MTGLRTAPRRVLHLINTAGPGGAETVYSDIVRTLDVRRWTSYPVIPEIDLEADWLGGRLRRLGLEPIFDESSNGYDIAYLTRLARRVRRERIDVIHCHLFGPTVEGALVGLLAGVPVIGTIHGRGDLMADERLRRVKFGILNRLVARVVFVSGSLRDYFLAQGSLRRGRTAVIPNGIDVAAYGRAGREEQRAELGFGPERFVVGALGNLRRVKRYDLFLRAAALLKERSPDYAFVIIGQTQSALHRELLELRDSLGLQDMVRFTDFREDVPELLAALDAFALTSDSEGFSIATVQAMATGLPVVATRSGGPEEILRDGETGVLVETGSPEAIADAVEALRRDKAGREAMGAAAGEDARKRFSLDAQVRSYEALYERVITGRDPAPEAATERAAAGPVAAQ